MNWIELAKVLKEIGIGVGSFVLCAWMVIYIVKKMGSSLTKLELVIDKQLLTQEFFMSRVKEEHDNLCKDHKEFAKQNSEITAALGRINGFKRNN